MIGLGNFEIAFASNELTLTASIAPKHRTFLATYRMNAHRGPDSPRDLILRDIRNFLDLGAIDRATDLLIVLALYMRESSRSDRRLAFATRRQRDGIALQRWRGGARPHHATGRCRGTEIKAMSAPNLDFLPTEIDDSLENEDGDRLN